MNKVFFPTIRHGLLMGGALLALTACQPGGMLAPVGSDGATTGADVSPLGGDAVTTEAIDGTVLDAGVGAPAARATRLVDRDVEAPEVFQVSDEALWDGRPSLGGVWVASPDATDPERVILRNPSNGKFVIGALFRRERDNPGPALQISSDAADALGVLAGQPVTISVTALRREEAAVGTAAPAAPALDTNETVQPGAEAIAADAAAAIAAAEDAARAPDPTLPVAPKAEAAQAAPAPAAPAQPAAAGGRLIQIGIFSVEANAKRAVETLAKAGVQAAITPEQNSGKNFWSVTARGDKATLDAVKSAGFSDAYFLK